MSEQRAAWIWCNCLATLMISAGLLNRPSLRKAEGIILCDREASKAVQLLLEQHLICEYIGWVESATHSEVHRDIQSFISPPALGWVESLSALQLANYIF
jgi:hypothetical protein